MTTEQRQAFWEAVESGENPLLSVMHGLVEKWGLPAIIMCLGDIGKYFSTDNKEWENEKSEVFLKFSTKKIRSLGYEIGHIDTNIIIQKPKILKYRNKIINSISKLMNLSSDIINLKGKTVEKLGLIGKEKAIACEVIVSITKYD